jgi:23S rRNA (cytidine1920-2'-O)/16S rRNA (cytidine1409-2'-O)-methyltransferase
MLPARNNAHRKRRAATKTRMTTAKSRLDVALVKRGLASSRAQAADLVRRGQVSVAGALASKPGALVRNDAPLALDPDAGKYVSRGALKLEAALAAFSFHAKGKVALDIGASTGGFTDVLLARGACKVYAIDVGKDQLHTRLRADPRVVSLESTDVRALDAARIQDEVMAIVADLSFISLTQALPAALALAAPGAWLAALIKPQFEAGRAAVGKGGIVRKAEDRERAISRVRGFIEAQAGWTLLGVIPSPILGGSGNQEFLLGARHAA